MATITSAEKLYSYFLQQVAAESYLENALDSATVKAALEKGSNRKNLNHPFNNGYKGYTRLTEIQRTEFTKNFTVVHQWSDDPTGITPRPTQGSAGYITDATGNQILANTGLSATLIRALDAAGNPTNEYTLAIRSTEFRSWDDGGDNQRDQVGANKGGIVSSGFALAQQAALEKYYAYLKSKPELFPVGQKPLLNVTGYSLGGNLATVFTEMENLWGQALPLAYLTSLCNHRPMARPLRLEFPGAVYHVTSRGDRREAIFEDDQDREAFLAVVAQAMARFDAAVLAYCLMDNHYHLVIHTRRGNLSRLMQQLNGVYTQTYNRRHNKVGHLFQGRFKGILVDENAYLLEVCRYVDLNPVRARMVRDPGNWRWSSYSAHTGAAISPVWLDTPSVHGYLLGRDAASEADRRRAGLRYAALVAAGKGVKLWDEALANQVFLGGPDFVERMQALIEKDTGNPKDIPRLQRRAVAKPIEYYLKRNKDRDAGIRDAVAEGQHSMTDVGKVLGLTVSRVSRIVKAGNEG